MSGEEPSNKRLAERLVTVVVDAAVLDGMEHGRGVDTTDARVTELAEYFASIMLRTTIQLATQAGRKDDFESVLEDIYLMWLSHGETGEREQ